MVTLVPQHASSAVGGVKFQGVPAAIVMFVAQVITGGVVSMIVTVWLHVTELEQQSVARQVRVCELLQNVPRFWTVLTTVIATLVPQQASNAVGGLNAQTEPHWTVLLVAQVSVGGVVSVMRTDVAITVV